MVTQLTMKKKLFLGVLVVLVIAAALMWVSDNRRDAADREAMEQELRDAGLMSDDGTIVADDEFDAELNALSRELNAAESDGSLEIDALDTVE